MARTLAACLAMSWPLAAQAVPTSGETVPGDSGGALIGRNLGAKPDPGGPPQVPGPRPAMPELRLEVTSGSVTKAEVGAGLSLQTGLYVRVALAGASGLAWRRGERTGAARVEVQGRFHLDPFRESRLGAYGLGGMGVAYDGFQGWQPRLVLGLGVELPATSGATWAVEAALAGGVRLSAVLRGMTPGRR